MLLEAVLAAQYSCPSLFASCLLQSTLTCLSHICCDLLSHQRQQGKTTKQNFWNQEKQPPPPPTFHPLTWVFCPSEKSKQSNPVPSLWQSTSKLVNCTRLWKHHVFSTTALHSLNFDPFLAWLYCPHYNSSQPHSPMRHIVITLKQPILCIHGAMLLS